MWDFLTATMRKISASSTWASATTGTCVSRRLAWAASLSCVLLNGCSLPSDEVRRVRGPAGFDAVVAKKETWATDVDVTEVYVVRAHEHIQGDPVLRATGVNVVSIRWADDHTLRVYPGPTAKILLSRPHVTFGRVRIDIHDDV